MSKRNVLYLSLIIGMFILAGLYFLATNFPRGSYSIKEGQIEIEVSIRENILGFLDTDVKKLITITDGENTFEFDYISIEFDFELRKKEKNGQQFWLVDDPFNGIAKIENGKSLRFTDWSKEENELGGTDLETFTFESFEWRFLENGL